ncbi:hypothetical protein [Lentzea sp. E54]|uniref:hypothetical protein n=1 Tax=Lentzea xerophila TaxID=3435883 RepID=UPI003DA4367C
MNVAVVAGSFASALVTTRKSGNTITAPDAKPWLFLGKRPGHPIGDDAPATELSAAMPARRLGIHIAVADNEEHPRRIEL